MNARMRHTRLTAEEEALRAYRNPAVEVQVVGDRHPAEAYLLTFHCLGVVDRDGSLGNRHVVRMELPGDFPDDAPKLFVTTPHWHPNVYEGNLICLGGAFWTPTLGLEQVIQQAGKILEYQTYSVDDRANFGWEAHEWNAWMKRLEQGHGLPLGHTAFGDQSDHERKVRDAGDDCIQVLSVGRGSSGGGIEIVARPRNHVVPSGAGSGIVVQRREVQTGGIEIRRRAAMPPADSIVVVTRRPVQT